MPTPFESGLLNLKLFELRREPVLREARRWFIQEMHAETFAELIAQVSAERSASFGMVISYWDMAASMVTTGAIDGDAFRAAHGEIVATFAKIQPFLAEMRTMSSAPNYCKHMEAVVMAAPDAEATIAKIVESVRAAAKARREAQRPAGV
jgi:hypothetical protein